MNPHVTELDGRVSFSRNVVCRELESASYLQKTEGPKKTPYTETPKNTELNDVQAVNNSAIFKQSEINSLKQENLAHVNNDLIFTSESHQLELICPNDSYVSYSDNIDNISLMPDNTTCAQGVHSSGGTPNNQNAPNFQNPHQPNIDHKISLSTNNSPARSNNSIVRDSCSPQENRKLEISSVNVLDSPEVTSLKSPPLGSKAVDVEGRVSFLQKSNDHTLVDTEMRKNTLKGYTNSDTDENHKAVGNAGHNNSLNKKSKSSADKRSPSAQVSTTLSINTSSAAFDRENPHLPPKPIEMDYSPERISFAKVPKISNVDGQLEKIHNLNDMTRDYFQGCYLTNEPSELRGRVSFSQNSTVLNPQTNPDKGSINCMIETCYNSPVRKRNSSTANFTHNLPVNAELNSIDDIEQLTGVTPTLPMNNIEGLGSFSQQSANSVLSPSHHVENHSSPTRRNRPVPENKPLPQLHEHRSYTSSTTGSLPNVSPHCLNDKCLIGNDTAITDNRVSHLVKTSGRELKGALQKEDITLGARLLPNDPIVTYQLNTKSSDPVVQQRIKLPNSRTSNNLNTCCCTDSLNHQQSDAAPTNHHQQNADFSHEELKAKSDMEDLNSPRYLWPCVSLNPVTVQKPMLSMLVPKMDINHNNTYRSSSPNPHTVPNKINSNSLIHLRKSDVYHDSFGGHSVTAEPLRHDTKLYHNSPCGNLQTTEVYHDSLGGFSEGTEDMNLSSLSGYQPKLHVCGNNYSNEYQNSPNLCSQVSNKDTLCEDLMPAESWTSILKNSNVASNSQIPNYYASPTVSQNVPRGRRSSPRPITSRNSGNRNPHAILPNISLKPSTRSSSSCRPNSSYTPKLCSFRECASFPPLLDRASHNKSVIWEILSEATDEDTYSLYSYSSGTGSSSDDFARGGSARRREENKRQRYWNYAQPGLTVDELARHRRKRPPSSQKPKDSLKVSEGSFAHLKTEYRRRYRRNSSLLKSLEKLKPEDLLKLEGELKCSAEYKEEFVEHPLQREKLLRRPTSLKLEGPLETSTEVQEKFKYEESEKRPLIKQEASLKPEGDLLVNISEVHDKFIEFPGVKRPELTRKSTSLKLEGPIETCTETGDNFVQHPPQPLAKPCVRDPELGSATSPMAHEVTTEYRPEYKENYIAFEAKRPTLKKPEGSLKPEGTIQASTELRSEFKDFHPSRPVLHRNNSMLKPSGDFAGESEKRSEFRDFHPARPTIHRNNSLLKPSGEFERSTEKGSEYRDFHPTRPVLQRNNSQLRPSGDMSQTSEVRAEYKNFSPKRPIIHRVDSKLKPEGDMAKTTEVKSEYRDFHPSRPVLYRTPSHLAMEGQMEKESEIRAEYRDFHPSRPIIYRKNSLLKPEGDIEASTEVRSEYKDFHPSRPTIHRNNSLLKPEGEIGKESEVRSEYKDFHPGRPVIHRKNSMLHPEGEFSRDTEKGSEYKDFHPSRPVIHRKNSMLHPEGDFSGDTEKGSEYKDFHPSRPVIHRKNSMLHPEGDFSGDTEKGSEYKDFHPSRPVIHRKNSMLHPEGDFSGDTEKGSEYKDFHPSRPTIHRNNSLLRPEGDMMNTDSELKHEFKDHKPKRPTIYTENCNLKPGNRIEERNRALTPKSREYYVLEGEITIRPERSGGRALENIKNEERTSTAGRRLPGTSTLPRSRAVKGLLPDNSQTTERPGPFRFTVENVDDAAPDKAFVVLQDNNNNNVNNRSASIEDLPEFQNRWLRGSLRERAEPWRPSWALNPNTKDVTTT